MLSFESSSLSPKTRFVSIAMQRIHLGHQYRMGFLYVWIVQHYTAVLVFIFHSSTNLDTWSQDQLRLMSIGGNGRAGVFFKQHGWTEGGKIESKYTSRAADLYRQLLAKDAAKSSNPLSSSPASVPDSPTGFNFSEISLEKDSGSGNEKAESLDTDYLMVEQQKPTSAPAHQSTASSTRKPIAIGTKKASGGKLGGGLGVKKLTSKANESIYNQKPAELPPEPVNPPPSSIAQPAKVSRFTYLDDQETENRNTASSGTSGHVLAPHSAGDFFMEFGSSSGARKSSGIGRSKQQVHAYFGT
ncbi:hypothetical protein KP509_1Z130300 [Ceratopteris richardii]|nr:hypothetical protein KP509_1Z130300 [Ceratopteris richardii]